MTYFIRNMDLRVIGAIIFLAAFGVIGWMEMHDGGSVINVVSPKIADVVTLFLKSIITDINELSKLIQH